MRRDAGIFDVSHMCVIDARGSRVREFLSRLLANDVARLTVPGKALYSCMLNEAGGVIDDLIVYYLDESFFRIVVNAGTRDKDLAWMRGIAPQFGVELTERTDLAMIAVQGPNARAKVAELLPAAQREAALALEVFFGRQVERLVRGAHRIHGRRRLRDHAAGTDAAESVWRALNAKRRQVRRSRRARHAAPGSRHESLRQRHGREPEPARVGARLDRVLRQPGARFHRPQGARGAEGRGPEEEIRGAAARGSRRAARPSEGRGGGPGGNGEITSGTFSPTMEKSIALARVPRDSRRRRCRSTFAANFSMHAWSRRPSCARARSWSLKDFSAEQLT